MPTIGDRTQNFLSQYSEALKYLQSTPGGLRSVGTSDYRNLWEENPFDPTGLYGAPQITPGRTNEDRWQNQDPFANDPQKELLKRMGVIK